MWKDEFIRCLDEMQLEKAFAIKHQHLPNLIYKYRKCEDHAFNNLETDTVWLAAASDYNDPYDSAITMSFWKLISGTNLQKLRAFVSDAEYKDAVASNDPMVSIAEFIGKKFGNKLPEQFRVVREAVENSVSQCWKA